jgi:Concanavalin A-like lectin/glucanases superfamily
MKKGISPIIAFVITVSIISVAITIVLAVINPIFKKVSDSTTTNEIKENLELINSAIKQVASESEGSKRTISISASDGNYFVNSTDDYIYCDYETKTDYAVEGTIGNVRLDKSPVFMEYFNHYTENSNGSPIWIVKNGTWGVESGEYSGQNGLAYYHYGSLGFFSFEGRITNKTGVKAEIFALPVAPNNLRSYWTFDEGAGTNTYDYSGLNNTGSFVNAPSWTAGKFDYSLQFNGVNTAVDIASLSDMGVTVALWKKNSTDNMWYHLVNSSGTLYVNGVTGSGQVMPITNVSGNVVIGRDSSGNYFNGIIDEVMIFNVTLTADQVKSLYETSYKKISSTGKSDEISQKTDVYLALATPVGHTHFDEVKIKTNKRELMLSIPYSNIDLNGTARFGKGNYQLTITHKGINTTVNKPIIEVMIY